MINSLNRRFKYFRFFEGYLKGRVYAMIALNMLVGILDGLGLSMFLPLLSLSGGNSSLQKKAAGKFSSLIGWLEKNGISVDLKSILLFIVLFFMLKGVAYYFKGIHQVIAQQVFIKKIRLQAIKAFSQINYAYYTLADNGRIQNTLTTEIERVAKACQSYFQAFQYIILIIVYVLFAFSLNWRFALMVCIGGLVVDILYRKIYKQTKGVSRRLTDGNSLFQGLITEFISGYKYLKSTGTVRFYETKLNQQVASIELNNKKIGVLSVCLSASREPLSVLVLAVVILLQVFIVNAPFATIMVSLLFFYRAISALMQYQTTWNSFLSVAGSLENTSQLIQEFEMNSETNGKLNFKGLEKFLVFEKVSYQYADHTVLNELSFNINKNEYVAIVGTNGSGKTTLANLITGLLRPSKGKITVDAVDITKINQTQYQQKIGYINQEPIIFNDNIFNNVTLWASATDENKKRFKEACQAAAIWDLVNDEEGMQLISALNLSGGQKQRIALARELFKQIDILIMDEATSSIDSFTEHQIHQSVTSLKGKLTIISVAHRLSTIKNADKIIYLNDGDIVQMGNFVELATVDKNFMKMIELQQLTLA